MYQLNKLYMYAYRFLIELVRGRMRLFLFYVDCQSHGCVDVFFFIVWH